MVKEVEISATFQTKTVPQNRPVTRLNSSGMSNLGTAVDSASCALTCSYGSRRW